MPWPVWIQALIQLLLTWLDRAGIPQQQALLIAAAIGASLAAACLNGAIAIQKK